jgi:hypothetical protein
MQPPLNGNISVVNKNRASPDIRAAGFWVRVVNVVAASYLTACEEALNASNVMRLKAQK